MPSHIRDEDPVSSVWRLKVHETGHLFPWIEIRNGGSPMLGRESHLDLRKNLIPAPTISLNLYDVQVRCPTVAIPF